MFLDNFPRSTALFADRAAIYTIYVSDKGQFDNHLKHLMHFVVVKREGNDDDDYDSDLCTTGRESLKVKEQLCSTSPIG